MEFYEILVHLHEIKNGEDPNHGKIKFMLAKIIMKKNVNPTSAVFEFNE